jgi:signal peptidase II
MWRYLWISVVVLVLDQLSKFAAVKYLTRHAEVALLPFLNMTLVYNTGAAFGFLSNAAGWQNLLFVVVALVACAIILAMARRLGPHDRFMGWGLMLVLGGAVGNLIDRLAHGYVIDFIDIYYRTWHWPVFNIADSAITIGAAFLIIDAIGIGPGRRRQP